MKPTINTIAKHAGVSRGTVDRVLHNRPNVNPFKRQKVLNVLKELNYSPNPVARALALNDKKIQIAMIVPCWGGFFEIEINRGIEDAIKSLSNYGVEILVRRCKTQAPTECAEIIDELVQQGVKGLAICADNSPILQKKLNNLSSKKMPIVTFNSDVSKSGRICFVGQDVLKGGRVAGEIMAKLVPKQAKILIVCGNLAFDAHKKRVDGFLLRYSELFGTKKACTVVQSNNDFKTTFEKVYKNLMLNNKIAGIYMANESVAACIRAIEKAGKNGKVKVLAHDLAKNTLEFLKNGKVAFVIEQNIYKQGFLPLSILADYLIAEKKPQNEVEYTSINIVTASNIVI